MSSKFESWQMAVELNIPVLLWGPPGVGKTARVEQYAKQTGRHMETIIASLREPADICGLPIIKDGHVILAMPQWAQNLITKGGILFIDEITTAPPAVQAALLRVVLDRVVGDTKLPENVRIIAAANPPQQAAGGWDLSLPLCNRFIHLDITVDNDEWMDGYLTDWMKGNDDEVKVHNIVIKDTIPKARGLVASYMTRFPTNLTSIPVDLTHRAYPTPRSWDMATKVIAGAMNMFGEGLTEGENGQLRWINETVTDLLIGTVGNGPAMEFIGYVRNLDIQDPEELIKDPDKVKVNKARADIVNATLVSLASAIVNKPTVERWQAGWKVLNVVAKKDMMDACIVAARVLCKLYTNNAQNKKWDNTIIKPVKDCFSTFQPYVSMIF